MCFEFGSDLGFDHVTYVTPLPSESTYAARVRWQPSGGSGVVGYRLYVRTADSSYGQGEDVGLPSPEAGGMLSSLVEDLNVRGDYLFGVTALAAEGTESDLSNEMMLGYAQVAGFVDSDGDGLSDAAEDVNLNRVVDPGETDPENPDTDGDGILDGSDRCQGTSFGNAVDELGCQPCATLLVDNLGFQNGRKRHRLLGRAVIKPVLEIDPTISGVVVELIDGAGNSLYRGEVPEVAFAANRSHRVFKLRRGWKKRAQPNDLEKLIFKHRRGRTVVIVKATAPELSEASGTSSLTWFMRSGATCMKAVGVTCDQASDRVTHCR